MCDGWSHGWATSWELGVLKEISGTREKVEVLEAATGLWLDEGLSGRNTQIAVERYFSKIYFV